MLFCKFLSRIDISQVKLLTNFNLFQDRIQPCDSISCLDIEKTFSESQRCFISIFTNILVFLLQEGECLQLIKNAHTVEITDIMFFKPLKVICYHSNINFNAIPFGNVKKYCF